MKSLSGTWLGTYWQQGIPTRFEVALIQSGNTLSGRILDEHPLGEAFLTGEAIAAKVNFLKRYLTGSRHVVVYTGTVGSDRDYMYGRWQINFNQTGHWEAHREGDNLIFDLKAFRQKQLTTPTLPAATPTQE
jgi:hypothetical protein